MEQDFKARFGIEAIEEKKFEISSSFPETLDASAIEVRYLIETDILPNQERIKVTTGVKYSVGTLSACELIVCAFFGITPFADIVRLDESKKLVSFSKEIMPTFLNITFGALRGVLFDKTKGTVLEAFPLPLVSMSELIEMNRFRVEKSAMRE